MNEEMNWIWARILQMGDFGYDALHGCGQLAFDTHHFYSVPNSFVFLFITLIGFLDSNSKFTQLMAKHLGVCSSIAMRTEIVEHDVYIYIHFQY